MNDIPYDSQMLLYDGRFITNDEYITADKLSTSDLKPIILVSKCLLDYKSIKIREYPIPTIPIAHDIENLTNDYKFSRTIAGVCCRCMMICDKLTKSQLFYESVKGYMHNKLISDYAYLRNDKLKMISDMKSCLHMLLDSIENERESLERIIDANSQQCNEWITNVNRTYEDIVANINYFNDIRKKLSTAFVVINSAMEQIVVDASTSYPIVSRCKNDNCIERMKQLHRLSSEICAQFNLDRYRQMSYNDEQIHKWNSMRIKECVTKSIEQLKKCTNATNRHYTEFQLFMANIIPMSGRIELINKNVKFVQNVIKESIGIVEGLINGIGSIKNSYRRVPPIDGPRYGELAKCVSEMQYDIDRLKGILNC
jgi:hypothetical protein